MFSQSNSSGCLHCQTVPECKIKPLKEAFPGYFYISSDYPQSCCLNFLLASYFNLVFLKCFQTERTGERFNASEMVLKFICTVLSRTLIYQGAYGKKEVLLLKFCFQSGKKKIIIKETPLLGFFSSE